MKSVLKKTCFVFSLLLGFGPVKANLFDLDDPDGSLKRFSHNAYNNLKTVEDANSLLIKSTKLPEFMKEVKILAQSYGVTDILGIRLAHKHTTLLPEMRMVDGYENMMGENVLATRATNKNLLNEAIPTSWILGKKGETYKAFEYSTDPSAKKNFEILKTKPHLFNNFHELAKKYELENLLVPAIVKREWEEKLTKEGYTYYLEQSYESPSFVSVVSPQKEIDFKKSSAQPIITGWDLNDASSAAFICTMTRYCADFGNGHPSQYYHAVSN